MCISRDNLNLRCLSPFKRKRGVNPLLDAFSWMKPCFHLELGWVLWDELQNICASPALIQAYKETWKWVFVDAKSTRTVPKHPPERWSLEIPKGQT